MDQSIKEAFAALTQTVERGFAAVSDDLADIRNTMATREATATGFADIISELADIKARLKAVEAAVEDHAGHSKEIDHALERIAAIEKHLGINTKVAASPTQLITSLPCRRCGRTRWL